MPALPLGATAGDVVRRAIAASVLRLIRHDPGMRLDRDPEDVHQARVATRRLRSDLRTFRGLVHQPLRALTRQVKALHDGGSDDELHQTRMRVKRVRYAAEAVAPVLGKRARATARAAAWLQEVLGEHQDAVVAERWLGAWVQGTREARSGWQQAWQALSARRGGWS